MSHRVPIRPLEFLRAQLGSVRSVYLGTDPTPQHHDYGGGKEVVLLLHGFFQTRNIWSTMERRLRRDGYAVMSFQLGGMLSRFNTRPIDKVARTVSDKVESLCHRHDLDALHIIGHSKGGLVGRRYIQRHGGDRRAMSLTTLGTPHRGTWTAALATVPFTVLGHGPAIRELLPGSSTVRDIHERCVPKHVAFTSIYSKSDLICPWRSAVIHGDASHGQSVEISGLGHSELTWSVEVYREVKHRLELASVRHRSTSRR